MYECVILDPEHDYKKEFKSDANGLYCLKLDRIPFKDEEQVCRRLCFLKNWGRAPKHK